MTREKNIIIFIINIFLIILGILILILLKKYVYTMFFIALLIITIILLVNYIKITESPESIYYNYLKQFKKTFNSVIVILNKLPDIKNKTIIEVAELDDLLDFQIKLNKPILIFEEEGCCTFMLSSNNDMYVSVLKLNAEIKSKIEYLIRKEEDNNLELNNLRK